MMKILKFLLIWVAFILFCYRIRKIQLLNRINITHAVRERVWERQIGRQRVKGRIEQGQKKEEGKDVRVEGERIIVEGRVMKARVMKILLDHYKTWNVVSMYKLIFAKVKAVKNYINERFADMAIYVADPRHAHLSSISPFYLLQCPFCSEIPIYLFDSK